MCLQLELKNAVTVNMLTILIRLNEFKYTNIGDVIVLLCIEQERNVGPDT
jgi:hypothetical protein